MSNGQNLANKTDVSHLNEISSIIDFTISTAELVLVGPKNWSASSGCPYYLIIYTNDLLNALLQ